MTTYNSRVSPKKVRFYINGHSLGEYQFKGDMREKSEPDHFVISLPARYLTGGLEELKIACSEGTFWGPGFSYFFGYVLVKFGWVSNETFQKAQNDSQ
jgi:hypothetical protein